MEMKAVFRLYESERLENMVESIREHGVLNPVIVREMGNAESRYEMPAGHNRLNAARIAGLETVPAIVKKDLPDEEAYVYVVETNVMQRSFAELLPSEKAAVMSSHYQKMCGTMRRDEILRELEELQGKKAQHSNGGHNDHRGDARDDEEKTQSGKIAVIVGIVAVVLAVVLGFRACGGDLDRVILGMPEYEDRIFDSDGEGAEGERINLAVVPDMVVTKEKKEFPLPYPEENVYEVEFSFVNEENKEVYHTKRIKPGMIVAVPAYDFCADGEHRYQIEVEVYDQDTFKPVQSAVALEMLITKE